MKEWIEEVLMVLAYSRRTQMAIILGPIGFFSIFLLGTHQLDGFQFHGILAPYTEYFRAKILHRYDKAAWFCLISFWAFAFKLYRKDRKRFFESF